MRKVMIIIRDNVFYEFRIFYPHLLHFHIVMTLSNSASNRVFCLLLLRDLKALGTRISGKKKTKRT
jgi:hypothetical protein